VHSTALIQARIRSWERSLFGDSGGVDGFRKDWRRRTNVFTAQEWRDDKPVINKGIAALQCENDADVKEVLEISPELDCRVVDPLPELALLRPKLSKLEEFHLPGIAEGWHSLEARLKPSQSKIGPSRVLDGEYGAKAPSDQRFAITGSRKNSLQLRSLAMSERADDFADSYEGQARQRRDWPSLPVRRPVVPYP